MDSAVTLEIPRADTTDKYPRVQSERFTSPSSADMAPVSARTFTIRSVRVDNFSNQWLRVGYEFDYIPPYTTGVIFNVRGMGSIGIVREVPAPLDAWVGPNNGLSPTAVAGETYTLVLYDKPQMPSLGRPLSTKSQLVFDSAGAVNSPIFFTSPQPLEIISVELQYTASAVVGARIPALDIVAPVDRQWRAVTPDGSKITAGVNAFIGFGQGVAVTSVTNVAATNNIQTASLPVGMTLGPGDIIRAFDLAAIDGAGDTVRMVILAKWLYPRM